MNPPIIVCSYCTNQEKAHYLATSARRHGYDVRFVVQDQQDYQGFCSKIFGMRDFVLSMSNDDDDDNRLVCFVDAYDVLANASLDELVAKFQSFEDADLVIGAEMNSYPEGYMELYPPTPVPSSNYRYVNSGGYMGRVKALRQVFSWKTDDDEIRRICAHGGDQTYFIQFYLAHCDPSSSSIRVVLDHNQVLFQNMYRTMWNEFVFHRGSFINVPLRSVPGFIHFNGQSLLCQHVETGERGNTMEVCLAHMDATRDDSTRVSSLGDHTMRPEFLWDSRLPSVVGSDR